MIVFSIIATRLHHEYRFAYRIVISLVFGGVVLTLFISDYFICDMIARIGLFCFELLFFTMAVNITANLGLNTIKFIALPEFGYMFAELIGSVLIWTKPTLSLADQNGWFVGVMLASLFFVYCYVLTENNIIDVESWGLYPEPSIPEVPSDGSAPESQSRLNYMSAMKGLAEEWACFLAKERGLSNREKEIVVLLALGYSRGQNPRSAIHLARNGEHPHLPHIPEARHP